ncbi:MAG: xanthine dehydrogenase family protein subunit M [Candidatus Poribacteria bacterium]|nr:xanthine dehydrogenase family protein subunit M [Candidatus Poribacteria bacterium]
MRAFEYTSPKTVSAAADLLAEKGDQARVLAGGTDLIVQVREGKRHLERIVDIKDIPEANVLTCDAQAGLHLGSAVPCYKIYGDKAIASAYPALADSTHIIGGTAIQGRAAVGGNLCNASPAADTIPALIVLEGICVIAGTNGTREVPVERFCTGPGTTVLENGEFLESLKIPAPKSHSSSFYLRFIPRNEMDIAVVGAGASVVLDDAKESIVSARIALAAVAPTPPFAEEASALLAGRSASDESAIEEAAEAAKAIARPISDMRGSAEQRVHLVGVLTKRALNGAIQRVKES